MRGGVSSCPPAIQYEEDRIPHMRGGVSCFTSLVAELLDRKYSPHAWGCFLEKFFSLSFKEYSPHAWGCFSGSNLGIPHMRGGVSRFRSGIPHMRGGVSRYFKVSEDFFEYSPHAWGCFQAEAMIADHGGVFPTCVGVFPFVLHDFLHKHCIPHMRGGVSPGPWIHFLFWSLVVFPTCVGVFLGISQ